MPNVIKMPTPVPRDSQELPSLPNYAGHFLCLNPEKVRTFQCGGFILGPRRLSAVVPDDAQMIRIHRALDEGVLLDITQSGEIRTENFALQSPVENDTAKKVYFTERKGELVAFGTEDQAEQKRLDAQIVDGKLELPPGFGEEEKYLLKMPDSPKRARPNKAGLTPVEQAAVGQYRKLKPKGIWDQLRAWWAR